LGFVSHGWTTRYNNVNYYCVGLYMNHLSGHSSQLVFDKTFGDPRATPKAFTIKYLLKDAH
ncbi:MAG: hypothetical protein SV062_13990, partial [Thermodesulfobacteriota bacterium]|nr:hypothetical protein [Thermodesulfobacteriota bacterium]